MKCGYCGKVIRSKTEKENATVRYPTFCTFNCSEWARLQAAREHIEQRARQAYHDDADGDLEGYDGP